ncbi:large subunit ribosomal protein L25 [Paenibacillus sp. DS2015]|uniref:50S ribosomal protein L25 n=1 Tax=Paenibacillus sp. DS2015 TaxID=3373917 RepID=UPI003D1FF16C
MTTHSITAETRTDMQNSSLRTLRQNGRIPAVVYGLDTESISLHVDAKEMLKVARTGRTEMFNLKLAGSKDLSVIIKDFQKKNGQLSHVDFLQISANKPLRVRIPIDYQGVAKGSLLGGVVQHLEQDIEVEGLPADLPTSIEVDISHLDMGDKLGANEVKLPKGITLISSGEELLLASVTAPRSVIEGDAEAEATEEAAAPAQTEEKE